MAKKKSAAGKKKVAAKAAKKASPSTKIAAKKKSPKPSPVGRPKVPGDEKLYMLFKEDYPARQVFEFLRVETVKDLEEHSSQEIFKRLTRPMRETVERIRLKLAENNRCLTGDEDFLKETSSSA